MAQGRSKAMMANIIQKADSAMDSAQAVARTSYRETEMEHLTRRARGFYDVEARLPNIRPQDAASDKRPAEATNLLSYLGPLNPFAKQITENDTVWLLDNTAYRNPETNQWEAEFVAAVFDKNTGMEVSTVVADIAEKIGLGKGDTQEANIRDRLMPFMQSILPGRVVKAQFGRHHNLKLGPGGRNAISNEVEKLPDHRDGDVVTTIARVPQGANGILEMKTVYAEPEGWGVISDIDDSIKITQTSDPIGILHTTFASKPTPIAGMPELYAYLQTLITTSAPFFYLSASPYNLYPFLSTFRQQYYPQGTMILRDASWMNLSGLLSNLTLGTQDYKDERMTKIHSWVPKRKMICVGDSTQSDPEAYGDMYRKYPGWVHLILIRKVTDIAAIGIDSKNEPERFEKAFKGVPTSRWHLFTNPEECYQIINDIVQSSN